MEQPTKPSSLAAPRPRRKLQKSITKQKNFIARRLGLDTSNDLPPDNKSDTAKLNNNNNNKNNNTMPRQPLPHPLPVAPDLSDPKWSEYIRDSGSHYALASSTQQQSENPPSPAAIIPELSHLALYDGQPPPTSSTSSSSTSSNSPSTPSTTTMRRRAKTPIFSIYQLEEIPRPGNALASDKRLSAEVIAEQYRALLDSRNSMARETYPDDDDAIHLRRNIHTPESTTRPLTGSSSSSSSSQHPTTSPTSSDGTLVAFDDETVYFKPVSFSPEPISPFFDRRFPTTSPPPTPNLGLQICLDLLTRDLSSSLRRSGRNRGCVETSALQVWAMIEAYERLRDQLPDTEARLGRDEQKSLDQMLDLWLRALYAVHDSLTGDGRTSESDYGGELDVEDLD
ncbi:hypothetical protein B0T22DRAFT_28209 [Podospora appendiculata]|uniref:Uncharacterized protein n=1 Tax=Podospora appendiculata TaxID=314037 RepID=A0AAE1CFN1_9PEZI|nr:hypothetical protein B0T22DRAFT_28209 [Podospora appendiculata]